MLCLLWKGCGRGFRSHFRWWKWKGKVGICSTTFCVRSSSLLLSLTFHWVPWKKGGWATHNFPLQLSPAELATTLSIVYHYINTKPTQNPPGLTMMSSRWKSLLLSQPQPPKMGSPNRYDSVFGSNLYVTVWLSPISVRHSTWLGVITRRSSVLPIPDFDSLALQGANSPVFDEEVKCLLC